MKKIFATVFLCLSLLACKEYKGEDEFGPGKNPKPDETADLAVRNKDAGIQACYKTQWTEDKTLSGEVFIRMYLDINGKVRDVKIWKSTLENEKVEKCLVDLLKKISVVIDHNADMVNYTFSMQGGIVLY